MNLEQVNSTPARWYTLLGLLLVPVLVAGGFLIAGLNSDSSLRGVQAAIVNLDDPVTIDGTYIPLGRQLTANLVDSDRVQNLTWSLDSEANARAGLATGTYAAMVIIPKNFSAAATSYSKDAADAQRATIELATSPVAGVADATLGKSVALAATTSLNETLTSTYLDNIYVGFNDMGKQFTTMSEGATELADGTNQLADGVSQAADGSKQLYSGASQLANGMATMKSKTASMPADTKQLAAGVTDYVKGVNGLVDQTTASLPGQVKLASGVKQLSQGAGGLSGGLKTYQSALKSNASAAQTGATGVGNALSGYLASAIPEAALKGAIDAACPSVSTGDTVTDAQVCIGSLSATAKALDGAASGLGNAGTEASIIGGAAGLAGGLSSLNSQLQSSVPDVATTTAQLKQLKAGGNKLASGTKELAAGMPALTDGIAQSADGAAQLASGVDQLSAGLIEARSGGAKLADGMAQFADGIVQGKDKLPSYSATERENLTEVVAAPVSTDGLTGLANPDVGWVTLLLVLALWLGGLATYVALKPVVRGLLGSAESSAKLIAGALVPGIAVVAAQALILGALAHLALDLSWPKTFAVTGVLLIAAVAFAVINHALAAWAGGLGRLISMVFAVVTTAATLAAAAPGALSVLRPFSPLTPALDSVRAVITESGGAAAATFTLVGWLLLGLLASSVVVIRHRTTTLAEVLAA